MKLMKLKEKVRINNENHYLVGTYISLKDETGPIKMVLILQDKLVISILSFVIGFVLGY